jgi:hypothetical protein
MSLALTLGGWGSVATLIGVLVTIGVPGVKAVKRLFRSIDEQLVATRKNTEAVEKLTARVDRIERGGTGGLSSA